ncbi:uncharacterized protein DUF222 [Kribbella antiqua]|uniref:Uncharacterized protein DUF222 n=1 Tax=Kribbella antiqua TaxID=2512217 RepID=A0A4R2IWZ7_9ACTN|nr:HNH endonuclease signature motif containing protein [Kribbella antiqua]TCO48758.1 uncharacterized protein DUF222 [Kribbella antiqua]
MRGLAITQPGGDHQVPAAAIAPTVSAPTRTACCAHCKAWHSRPLDDGYPPDYVPDDLLCLADLDLPSDPQFIPEPDDWDVELDVPLVATRSSRVDDLDWQEWHGVEQDEAERALLGLGAPAWLCLPPGGALATALEDTRPRAMSPIALIELLKAATRMAGWAEALKAEAMASFYRQRQAEHTEAPRPTQLDTKGRPIDPERSWHAELALALGVTKETIARKVTTALRLTSTLRATHTALKCGALTWGKALAISEATADLPDDAAHAVEAHVLKRAPQQTHRNLLESLRRQVAKHTTREDTDNHRAAVADRTCKIVPLPNGMAGLWIVHTADKIQQIWVTIQAMATLAKRGTPTTTDSPTAGDPTTGEPATKSSTSSGSAATTRAPSTPATADAATSEPLANDSTHNGSAASTRAPSTPATADAATSEPVANDSTHNGSAASTRAPSTPATADAATSEPLANDSTHNDSTTPGSTTNDPSGNGDASHNSATCNRATVDPATPNTTPNTTPDTNRDDTAANAAAATDTTHAKTTSDGPSTTAPHGTPPTHTTDATNATAHAASGSTPGRPAPTAARPDPHTATATATAGQDDGALNHAPPTPHHHGDPTDTQANDAAAEQPHTDAATEPGKDTRTAEQRRADVTADLFEHILRNGLDWLGRRLPDQHRRRPHIEVIIPASTLLGVDNHPAELTGYGPIPAEMARRIAEDGTWRRLLTDPVNGIVLEAATTRHDPGALVTETLLARHPVCAWPGCNRTSRDCDRDHTTPFAQSGTTTLTGLAPYCEYHHVIKDTPTWGWTTTSHPDGSITLTTPTGHRHTTVPPARGPITAHDPNRDAHTDTDTESGTGSSNGSGDVSHGRSLPASAAWRTPADDPPPF